MATSFFPATRWSLVDQLTGNDGMALFLDQYAGAIGRYLAGKFPDLRQRGNLDDLVQEVLISLLNAPQILQRAEPGSGSRFRWYLMRVAYNAARNARRRLANGNLRLLAEVAVSTTPEPESACPDQDMDHAWAMNLIEQAWCDIRAWVADGILEPEALALLEQTLVEGATIREVAQHSGLSLGTAHRRVAKARSLLRQAVIERLRFAGEVGPTSEGDAFELLMEAVRKA